MTTRAARRARTGGFTLVELLIALSIVGALLAIAFGGLRVGISAWNQGEERAEYQQHTRGLTQIVGRAVAGAYPYRGPRGEAPERRLLFEGSEDRIEFVTQTPPFPMDVPAAFTAVVISLEDDPQQGGKALVVRQRLLPNREPFTLAVVALRDPMIQGLEIRYLGEGDAWQSSWEGEVETRLPLAVRIRFATRRGDRVEPSPPMTVSLRTTASP